MSQPENPAPHSRAAIVLAGGEGTRLRSLTKFIWGAEVPKQFCPLLGERTMLEETLVRAHAAVPAEHTVVVVNRAHQRFYRPLLRGIAPHQVVEQPCNRGTAPAVFFGLRRLLELGREATVAVFPSDHFIDDTQRFAHHIEMAFQAIDEFPQLCVLLGSTPNAPERSYGWLEPDARISFTRPDILRVRRFWEKPDQETAARLYRTGCLWNSFIIVAALPTLHAMFAEYAPELFCTFGAEMAAGGDEEAAAERLYERLKSTGFSEQILSQCPPNLAVMKMDDVEWNDLGEPARVLDVVASMRRRPRWFENFASGTTLDALAAGK
ncbi:MAG: sugar phosphate nucleotidyltransferase [Candidatus Binataceae bacterium]